MRTIETRLAQLEAARALALLRDPVDEWLQAFRRGDPVEVRNAAAGAAWCDAAAERERLALETMVDYGDD